MLLCAAQVLSVMETQYSGANVIVVSPDSDNLSVLQVWEPSRHLDLPYFLNMCLLCRCRRSCCNITCRDQLHPLVNIVANQSAAPPAHSVSQNGVGGKGCWGVCEPFTTLIYRGQKGKIALVCYCRRRCWDWTCGVMATWRCGRGRFAP